MNLFKGNNLSETIKRKRGQFALLKAVTAFLVVIIIVLNVLFGFLGDKVNLKIDLTSSGLLKFSEETITVLKNLDTEVNMYSLVPEDDTNFATQSLREIIEKYAKLSGKIKYTVIDANKNPAFVNKYIELGEQLTQYTVIFETDKKYRAIDLNDAVSFDSQTQTITGIKAEQLFTSALMYVTNENDTKIGVVSGHGEAGDVAYFSELLKGEGYTAVDVNLLSGSVPDGVNMLIITTPQTDYTSEEITILDEFLDNGNSVQMFFDITGKNLDNLTAYLAEWGVEFTRGFMVENDANYYYQTPIYVLPQVLKSDATGIIAQNNLKVLAPSMMPLKPCKNASVTETPLLKTSKTSICKMDLQTQTVEKEEGDSEGEQVIAALYEREANNSKRAKLFVSGGSAIIAYDIMNSAFANKDFYFNIISNMSGNDKGVYIRAKEITSSNIAMPALTGIIYAALTVLVIPLALIIAGIVIWIKRRHL